MDRVEFLSRLQKSYGVIKDDVVLREYSEWLFHIRENEVSEFWEYVRDNHEYNTLPKIGRLEKLRREWKNDDGKSEERSEEWKNLKDIGKHNIEMFQPTTQIQWANYWLYMCAPTAPLFRFSLGIIARYVSEEAAKIEEARLTELHKSRQKERGIAQGKAKLFDIAKNEALDATVKKYKQEARA